MKNVTAAIIEKDGQLITSSGLNMQGATLIKMIKKRLTWNYFKEHKMAYINLEIE